MVRCYVLLFSGGKQGQRYEGKKSRCPKERVLKRFIGTCIPHSNVDTGMVFLSSAMPVAYDGKQQNQSGSFLAHCSTSLLPRISLGLRGSGVNPHKSSVYHGGLWNGDLTTPAAELSSRTFGDHGNVLCLWSTCNAGDGTKELGFQSDLVLMNSNSKSHMRPVVLVLGGI